MSVVRSTQALPQKVVEPLHAAHAPAAQTSLEAVHEVPTTQAPEPLHVSVWLLVVHPSAPFAQTPMHDPPEHVELLHGLPFDTHVPLEQVWGCWPLQLSCPGAHEPVHWPLMHVELLHVTELPQVPEVVHVWTPLPELEHCVWLGAHVPWHAPETHAWLLHAAAAPQAPVLSHVWTPLLDGSQRVAPGVQTPAQAPETHAWLVQETAVGQLPVLSQV
jgi:hypothetical protein